MQSTPSPLDDLLGGAEPSGGPHGEALLVRERPRRVRPSRRRRRVVIALISTASVLVLVMGGAGVGLVVLSSRLDDNVTRVADSEVFPHEKSRPSAAAGGATNVLLLGSDSRATGDDLAQAGGQRSDVMMLMNIAADRQRVSLMSIMRDSYVSIPGHGTNKINAALAFGGTPLVVETVEDLLGARIDHVSIIDFAGLADLTTSLGGVQVDNAVPFRASSEIDSGQPFFAQGPIVLEGSRALAFVRERHAFATADYQRVRNQQALMKGIISRAVSRDVLANPRALLSFADDVTKNLTVDSGFTFRTMADLAWSLRGDDLTDFRFFTMPTAGTGTSPDGQSIVTVDDEKRSALRQALADDTVGAFADQVASALD